MQVKVVIGTISFMLVMVILGLVALLEPARLERATAAFEGRQIENGAALFKDSCAECHGVEGKAQECKDFDGNEKACAGIPLNHAPLLCGEPSERMLQLGWSSSKRNLIQQTIASGRPGTQMPTWSNQFGGPMEDYQIDQLTSYILNWGEDPALCGEGAQIVQVEWPETWEDLPEGNAEEGAAAYGQFACTACHGDPDTPGSNTLAPHLGNIGNVAAERIPGLSPEEYIYESILDPSSFIVDECPTGPCATPSVMEAQGYDSRMNEQQMADLIAYYMTLTDGN